MKPIVEFIWIVINIFTDFLIIKDNKIFFDKY